MDLFVSEPLKLEREAKIKSFEGRKTTSSDKIWHTQLLWVMQRFYWKKSYIRLQVP